MSGYYGTYELIPRNSIEQLAANYKRAAELMQEGLQRLADAQQVLQASTGNEGTCKAYLIDQRLDNWDIENPVQTGERLAKRMLKSFWSMVVDRTNMEQMTSRKRRTELREQMEKGDMPAFTEENIAAFLTTTGDNLGGMVEDAIREVYRDLTPQNQHFKTNDRQEIGKRVILEWAIQYGNVCLRAKDTIRDLENILSLLDGKGPVRYPADCDTVIRKAEADRRKMAETPYMKLKWFKKGTLHIEFKRLDLVAELNRIGGGGTLKSKGAA